MLSSFSTKIGNAKEIYEKTDPFINAEQSVIFPQVLEHIHDDY